MVEQEFKQQTTQADQNWAAPVDRLSVKETPEGAVNLNVDGRQLSSPLQGFGQMWQKTFQVRLAGLKEDPAEVLKTWQAHFPEFQPPENRFYPTMSGIEPGGVLLINSKVPPLPGLPSLLPVSTGVMVLYADQEMFTVMCPEGHPLSGWNSFRVFEDDDGTIVAEVKEQSRASDPMYEFFFRFLGSSAQQDQIWVVSLYSLLATFHPFCFSYNFYIRTIEFQHVGQGFTDMSFIIYNNNAEHILF